MTTTITAGWKLVPIEPNEAMLDAGCKQHRCEQGDPWYSSPDLREGDCRDIYAAMLNAAPAAPGVSRVEDAQDGVTVLPDGSACALASFPLPATHWLYAEREYAPGAEEPKELPAPILTHAQRDAVVAAIRYAVRGATMCGKEQDFDPDALVQNAVYALCGPYGPTVAAPAAGDALGALRELVECDSLKKRIASMQVCVLETEDDVQELDAMMSDLARRQPAAWDAARAALAAQRKGDA